MARKKSMIRRLVVLAILGLACYGGYTIYKSHEAKVQSTVDHAKNAWTALK